MKKLTSFLIAILILTYCQAQTVLEFETFASGLNAPLDVVNAGDSMLYVVEQPGTIKLIDPDGNVRATPFLDIRDRVNSNASEQGLLGLVFHPAYPDSPYLYVNYTAFGGGATTISRFEMNASDPAQAVPASENILLTIAQPFTNHNAGDLAFGPDGYLYIPTGDGGSGNDPQRNGQNLMSLLAKMLRIDVDGGSPYIIPDDNPFAHDDFAADEIWAYGLRNPWRIDFDPENGDLYIADVGQNAFEEIDYQPASSIGGENYGWRCYEANEEHLFQNCVDSGYTFPVHAYAHPPGFGCRASISGGVVYRGSEYPGLIGKYIYGDYCTGFVGILYQDDAMEWQADTVAYFDNFDIVSFGRDIEGEIYMVAAGSGEILKVIDKTSAIENVIRDAQLVLKNPVDHEIILDSKLVFESGQLFDMRGRVVLEFNSTLKIIDVSNLSSGLYTLSIISGNDRYTQKIIIH